MEARFKAMRDTSASWARPDPSRDSGSPSPRWNWLFDHAGGIAWPAQEAKGTAWRLDTRGNPLHPLGRTGDVRLEIARRVLEPRSVLWSGSDLPSFENEKGAVYLFLLFLSGSGGTSHRTAHRLLHPFVAELEPLESIRGFGAPSEYGMRGLRLILDTLLKIGRDGVRASADLLDLVDENALRRWVKHRLEMHSLASRSAPRRMIGMLREFREQRHAPRAAKDSALRLETVLSLEVLEI